jgi:hypothetical protein
MLVSKATQKNTNVGSIAYTGGIPARIIMTELNKGMRLANGKIK